jgi:hypothetical protein
MDAVRPESGRKTSLSAFLLLRYTLIVATAYLLIVEEGFAAPPLGVMLLVVAALASNLVLGHLTPQRIESTSFTVGIIIGDTLWVTLALLGSGRFSGDFFYLYFLVLLMAAIGENLRLIAVGAVAICGAYLYLLIASGTWSFWIGIAAADRGIIFEPFRQAQGASDQHRCGAGLGLYIARRLVEMLEGTIALDSAVGRGSTFRLWIGGASRRPVEDTAVPGAGDEIERQPEIA